MDVCGGDCVPIIGWIFAGVALAAFAWNTWLITHSFWQLNVLNPENYAPGPGRRMHLRIVVSLACQIAALVAALFTFLFGTT